MQFSQNIRTVLRYYATKSHLAEKRVRPLEHVKSLAGNKNFVIKKISKPRPGFFMQIEIGAA